MMDSPEPGWTALSPGHSALTGVVSGAASALRTHWLSDAVGSVETVGDAAFHLSGNIDNRISALGGDVSE